MAPTELGAALVQTARTALRLGLGLGFPGAEPVRHPALGEPGATFVTLTQHGELRGCIGTLEAHRPLKLDVEQNTLAAAFHDPRFVPLVVGELEVTRIEVSLLTAPAPLPFVDEPDLLQRLSPGVDGVVLAWRSRRATFLPQVWDSLPDPRDFLAALKHKAGLAANFWSDDIRMSRYAVSKFKEPAAPGSGAQS
jgi:AmmeMemoRadiSam system protein A